VLACTIRSNFQRRHLTFLGRAYIEDSVMAQAPTGPRQAMDNNFRFHLRVGDRAPSGRLASFYGSFGSPVPQGLATMRGLPENPLRNLILDHIIQPFFERVCWPLQTAYNRKRGQDSGELNQAISPYLINAIVSLLECMLAAVFLGSPVIIVYNISTTKTRMIVASILACVFPLPVHFLSKEAMPIFTLSAA